ncbi:hypothetical protein Q2941_19445 [Bradyrhizobium sp. UFLA05-153]
MKHHLGHFVCFAGVGGGLVIGAAALFNRGAPGGVGLLGRVRMPISADPIQNVVLRRRAVVATTTALFLRAEDLLHTAASGDAPFADAKSSSK